mmetsp:Transcript_17622/g.23796  ORF Transcript_17622/g.23796 Transcript_17622/m.23796 type:complete len:119 (-) Transcript_17622:60-416(-)
MQIIAVVNEMNILEKLVTVDSVARAASRVAEMTKERRRAAIVIFDLDSGFESRQIDKFKRHLERENIFYKPKIVYLYEKSIESSGSSSNMNEPADFELKKPIGKRCLISMFEKLDFNY